jgi:cysteinyl-tRNA synthetase
MALRLYNTQSQQVEPFAPADGQTVRMYTCGPTVYNYVHIGNLRTFTFQDILRRWLQYRGWKLHHVMNITDVEDKIIRNAMQRGVTIGEYTAQYEKAFLDDMATMRMQQPEQVVRATEHITEMLDCIATLKEKGFPEYGKLSHSDFGGMEAGARVDVDEYDKADARDFVLWKAKKDNEPCWPSDFGCGRPGWHIECSAMAMKYLGATLDIHAGGIDLTFPHHENEIAQSEAITGQPFARFWMHCEHLNVDMTKMSKSLGNIYTLRDLTEMGFAPEALRYVLASSPYRRKLNFTMDSMKAAATSIDRLRNFRMRLRNEKFPAAASLLPGTPSMAERALLARKQMEDAMDDDLNTAEALAAVFEYVREANSAMDNGTFAAEAVAASEETLHVFDGVFAVLDNAVAGGITDETIEQLIADRQQARKQKNFARADEIRQELTTAGIILEDTKDGLRWRRK